MRTLIGLSGLKGSGKDTAGAYLVERHGFKRLSFADALKQSAAANWGVHPSHWDTWKNDPDVEIVIRGCGGEYASVTARQFLQRYGTEAHREVFGDDFWVRHLFNELPSNGRFVITDSRFANECAAVKERGGYVLYIDRDVADGDGHASEVPPPEHLIDLHVDNNGPVERMYGQLNRCVDELTAKVLPSDLEEAVQGGWLA